VRIWGLGAEDLGVKKAEFIGLRSHPLLVREDGEQMGYIVEMFYDQPSGQVFLLTGAGSTGELSLFRVSLAAADPIATFAIGGMADPTATGHSGIVRSAVCMPGGLIMTAGEDGCVCAWKEQTENEQSESFDLEPSAYGMARGADRSAARVAAAPY